MLKKTIKPDSDIKFNVRIPSQLGETYAKVFPGKDLKSKEVVSTKKKRQVAISFLGDKIRLAPKDAEAFFAESVKEIILHLKNLLRQKSGRGIATLILVGGYAESRVLIQGIKSTFPEMRIIIPQEAAWSVLRGAVIFGHDPSLIKERRSKYTYGIKVFDTFDPSKHDVKYKYEEDGETLCRKLFRKLIGINDPVTVREYQNEKKFTLRKLGKSGNLDLYTSVSDNPMYVDEKGCSSIGYILSAEHGFLLNEKVNVMMRFGQTEIEIKAHQPKSNKTVLYYLGQ